MNASRKARPSRTRTAAWLATLSATIALAGVGQALIPASAGALMQEGEDCLYTPWLPECQEQNDGGGGGWGETYIGPGGGGSSGGETDYEIEHRAEINELDRELEKDAAKENAEDRERSAREMMERLRQEENDVDLDKKLQAALDQWNAAIKNHKDEITCSDRLSEAHRAQQEGKPALADSKVEDYQACWEIRTATAGLDFQHDPCSGTRDSYASAKRAGQAALMDQALDDLNFCTATFTLKRKEHDCGLLNSEARRVAQMDGDNLGIVGELLVCADREREMRRDLLREAKKRIKRRELAQRRK